MITRKKLMRDLYTMQAKLIEYKAQVQQGEKVDAEKILDFIIDGLEVWLTSLAENMKPGDEQE